MGNREGADFEIKARLPRTEGSAREVKLKGWRLEAGTIASFNRVEPVGDFFIIMVGFPC